MWSWHADRPNHRSSSSRHTHPPPTTTTHTHTHRHSRQNITHQPQQTVPTCPSYILTKTLPKAPLSYIPNPWLPSLETPMSPCCQYSSPHFTCVHDPPTPTPPSLTCVCKPTGLSLVAGLFTLFSESTGIPHIACPLWRLLCPQLASAYWYFHATGQFVKPNSV